MCKCKDCGTIIEGEDPKSREPCENCGSLSRAFFVKIEETITISDFIGYKIKNKSIKGKRKIKVELIDRLEKTNLMGIDTVRHIRLIDRVNNLYIEKVINWKTKECIYEKNEKLNEHRNHGSAKFKNDIND